jgi:hypothetical protein
MLKYLLVDQESQMQALRNHIRIGHEQDNLNIVIYSSLDKQHLRTMGVRLISDLFAFSVCCFLFWMSLERNQTFRFELTIVMILLSTLYSIGACLITVVDIFSFLGRVELVVDRDKITVRYIIFSVRIEKTMPKAELIEITGNQKLFSLAQLYLYLGYSLRNPLSVITFASNYRKLRLYIFNAEVEELNWLLQCLSDDMNLTIR